MTEEREFPPSQEVVDRALIVADKYQEMYDKSIADPDAFWLEQAKSYRGVFTELRQQLPENPDCVADLKSLRLRESERGLLPYVVGITTEHIETPAETACDWIIAELRLPAHDPDLEALDRLDLVHAEPQVRPGLVLVFDQHECVVDDIRVFNSL